MLHLKDATNINVQAQLMNHNNMKVYDFDYKEKYNFLIYKYEFSPIIYNHLFDNFLNFI